MNHYMRHWNLYIMDELKGENILNKKLSGVIHLERISEKHYYAFIHKQFDLALWCVR